MTFKIIRPQTIAETTEFSRASTALLWDSTGLLQTAAIDEPRLSYDPSDLDAPPTWLFEDAATNYCLRSNEFTAASWSKTNCSTPGATRTGADGAVSMYPLIPNATTNGHYFDQVITAGTFSVGQVTVCAVDVAQGSQPKANIQVFSDAGNASGFVRFEFATETITTGVGSGVDGPAVLIGAGFTELPNGIYRIYIACSYPTETGRRIRLSAVDNANSSGYLGDAVTPAIYFGNCQLEANSEPSSYIKTEGTTVTRAADIPGAMLTSSVPEDDYPEYNAGSTYALGDRVISTTTHRVYESLQAGNTGQPLPAANVVSTEWWLNVSATNRWKMFDNSITSQTTDTDLIATAIETVGRVDSVALLNASGRSARIIMEDDTEGVVYDQTYSLIDDSGIIDYYEYFFEPVTSVPNFSVQDLPLYANSLVSVIVENEGGVVAIGALVVGLSRTFGITELGASLGITDYSVKITDDFGNKTVLERAFNDRMEIQVYVENAGLDAAKIALASYRATAIVYIGSSMYGSMIQYGFFNDFNFVIAYPTYSVLNIEIEGLT